jgi:hypothetical protein
MDLSHSTGNNSSINAGKNQNKQQEKQSVPLTRTGVWVLIVLSYG